MDCRVLIRSSPRGTVPPLEMQRLLLISGITTFVLDLCITTSSGKS